MRLVDEKNLSSNIFNRLNELCGEKKLNEDSYDDTFFSEIESALIDNGFDVVRYADAGVLTSNLGWIVSNSEGEVHLTCTGTYLDESLNEDESTDSFEKIINTLKNIITSCGGDISYINRKYQDSNEIELSARFKPDKFSKYENEIELHGTLFLDDNLKLVSSDLMSSSGPNVLNYDYIKCLSALYSYFSSGNSRYDI